jgi:hypothetical protein
MLPGTNTYVQLYRGVSRWNLVKEMRTLHIIMRRATGSRQRLRRFRNGGFGETMKMYGLCGFNEDNDLEISKNILWQVII